MNNYQREDNETKIWGGVSVLLYLIAVVCAMLFVNFTTTLPEQKDNEGIEINFGDSPAGSGEEDLASAEPVPPTPTQSVEVPPVTPQGEVEIPTPTQDVVEVEEPPKPREVNQRALFPGRAEHSAEQTQGNSETQEAGNQGMPSGTPEGVEYSLAGRSLVGTLPLPDYSENISGKVIIDVVVDEQGHVTNATFRAQGSTTNNSSLISAARAAALQARFSPSENFMQGGSITYIFKMN